MSGRWTCHYCGRGFAHARYLVTYLINLHNEQPGVRDDRAGD